MPFHLPDLLVAFREKYADDPLAMALWEEYKLLSGWSDYEVVVRAPLKSVQVLSLAKAAGSEYRQAFLTRLRNLREPPAFQRIALRFHSAADRDLFLSQVRDEDRGCLETPLETLVRVTKGLQGETSHD